MSTTMDREDTYKIKPLQGSANYRTWKFTMKMVLQAKDLWEVVSGEEARPTSDKEVLVWDRKARKALATIALAMSGSEKENIIECASPKKAWEVLEKLYEGRGRNRKFMLLQELFKMYLPEREGNMDEYLRGVREKFSELATIGLKLEDDVKLAIILNGLPEQYRYLSVSFEKLEKVDFDELTARLMEEQMKIDPNAGRTALVARTGKGVRTLRCWGCNEIGHVRTDCPKERKEAKFAM
jgi:hypothetical protein